MKNISSRSIFSILLIITSLTMSNLAIAEPQAKFSAYENEVITILDDIINARLDTALSKTERLTKKHPNFNLAQLIYSDLLLAKSRGITQFAELANGKNLNAQQILSEAKQRWQYVEQVQHEERIPNVLLKLSAQQKHIVVVDLKKSRLYLFENEQGQPKLINDYYISGGKNGAGKRFEGDKKTPIGVYFVSRYLSPDTLPEFYGHGAFPINYPNGWDRHLGRTGHGIWLHGNPLGTFTRPPLDSDGCVTITNFEFDKIKPLIDVGKTPFIIGENINWQNRHKVLSHQKIFSAIIDKWVKDWESMDNQLFLSHYSQSFKTEKFTYDSWVKRRKNSNKQKTFIHVNLDNLSIFSYPSDENIMVVTFDQHYDSNNFSSNVQKRLYWKLEKDGVWRIFYEGLV